MDLSIKRTKHISAYLDLVLVLILSFALNITHLNWGLPNYLDWANDSVAPFQVLEAGYYRLSNGWHNTYPPVHYAILLVFIAPFIGYLLLSGGLQAPRQVFPFGFSDPLSALTNITLISRFVSVLMGVAIVFLVYRIVLELFDRRSALFSSLIVALCHPLVYYAHTANVEVPYLFWSLLAIYHFLRALQQGALKNYMLFAMFGILAICTKDQAYGLFILSPLPLLWVRLVEQLQVKRQERNLVGIFLDKRLVLAAVVAVVTFALAQNLMFNFTGFLDHIQLITGAKSEGFEDYTPDLEGRFQLLWHTLSYLIQGLTPPLFGLCLVGSIYCAFKFPRYSLPLLFLALTYYLFFLNVILFVRLRYILPIAIIMAFFGGKVLADIWHRASFKVWVRTAICLIFAYAAFFPIHLNILLMQDSRYAAAEWMEKHFSEGDIVETFTPYVARRYNPRFPSWVKVRSSKLEAGTKWEIYAIKKVREPNLYTGDEPADYIVLSEFWYRRFLEAEYAGSDHARVLDDLFEGRMGYTQVATFKSPEVVPIDLAVNPQILIFARCGKATLEKRGPRC